MSPEIFYPDTTETVGDQMKYYASRFDMLTISSTYNTDDPPEILYTQWVGAVSHNPNFRFVVVAPKKFTSSPSIWASLKEWDKFWNGYEIRGGSDGSPGPSGSKRGGCKILYERGVLGVLVLQFDSSFGYTERHLNKIIKITKQIPSGVKLSFEFLHWSWRDSAALEKVIPIFVAKKWSITTSFVENGLVEFGWAGTLRSTRTENMTSGPSVLITSDFVHLSFSGTYGPQLGSYDSNGFLEKLTEQFRELQQQKIQVFCSFDVSTPGTTYCYPLPAMQISGFYLRPKMTELPSHTLVDRPCCLHDAIRLKELVSKPKCAISTERYKRDEEGYVVFEFV